MIITLIFEYSSKAFLASSVSSAESLFWIYMYHNLENWSTNIVVQVYLFVVSLPVICAINSGVGDFSWSTETQAPSFLGVGSDSIYFQL